MELTDVLTDCRREVPGLQRTILAATFVHLVVVAVVVLNQGRLSTAASSMKAPVMTITLGVGAPGPQSGGFTRLGGRPAQTVAPPAPRETPAPPAPRTTDMSVPTARPQRPPRAAPQRVEQAPDDAHARTPSRGAEAATGNALVETSVRGTGFGLSTSGGVGTGVRLDVVSFCCPDYLDIMGQRIRQNWDPSAETASRVEVKFSIARDGRISPAVLESSSGSSPLDVRAVRAVATTAQLPPLPQAFPDATLVVHLTFEYVR